MNPIASAHICLLSDFMRFMTASIRSIAELSPEAVKKLEDNRDHWQGLRGQNFGNLLLMTKLVAWGVVLEGPELAYELWSLVKRWRKRLVRDHAPALITLIGLIGWILVAVGVAGEFWADSNVNSDDQNIQAINEQLLKDASSSSGSAKSSARDAASAAKEAKDASADAKTLARGARREADSFAKEIAFARKEAADAVSRLADAEQRLAESTQREAAAEAKLSAIKTPRSLIHTDGLVAALKPFSGTEYILNVFLDDESIRFTQTIAKALDAAGWVRKQPTNMDVGIPTIELVLGKGAEEKVPACIEAGISLHAHAKESLAILQSTPIQSLPKTMQAAIVLKSAIAPSISPPDDGNVQPGILDPKPGEGIPMTICVGKKP